MTQGMAEQQELLTWLVNDVYGGHGAVLHAISPYLLEDRGIYRVDWADGTSSILRAFLADVTDELLGHAAVLDYLQQRHFLAPTVKYTHDGKRVASYADWRTLMVSFLVGEMADFALPNLELLGNLVGHLHTLSCNVLAEEESAAYLPESRLRPTQEASQAIVNFAQALPHVPVALRSFCENAMLALQQIQQAQQSGLLPEVIIHGDCWPGNAVLTPEGEMALIDWDGAGIGPALLDLGYLLLTCHLGQPQLPAMHANEACIAAVVRGYCQQRKPGNLELSMLKDAVLYDVARRVGLEKLPAALVGERGQEIWLQKMQVRYHVCPEIAAIALRCFEQEM